MRRILLFLFLSFCTLADAYDLSKIHSEKLDNGLTVLFLEDHLQPLVSTQMLYKVGARNECVGTTGLAHFMEHMAFRGTKNFPATVSPIYAVGGEWHGYTWIDETTYFETVPLRYFDLVLKIQADRMQNALINADEVDAERGAVLTELHSYENDPALVLSDQVLAASFVEHPYRYNTVGWTSDVEKINHQDLINWYHRYYHPSNAVLAITGDLKPAEVMSKVRQYFGAIPGAQVDSMPRTVEPPQRGIRRVTLEGSAAFNYFQITYRAPAAMSEDYPAFLLLQAILGGAPGLNLWQDLDGEVVHEGTRLAGIGHKISTFLMPTAGPYVFSVTGQAERSVKTEEVEGEMEKRIAAMRNSPVSAEELERARKQLLGELVFDIETPEDASHQMAYFAGIGALKVLQEVPARLRNVRPADVQAVAQKYLQPYQRTIGWFLATGKFIASVPSVSRLAAKHTGSPNSAASVVVKRLKNGVPVILRSVNRTAAGFLRILAPTNNAEAPADAAVDDPVWRYTSVNAHFLKEDVASALAEARKAFNQQWKAATVDPASNEDPEYRLNEALEDLVGARKVSGLATPVLITLVGDLKMDAAFAAIQKEFGNLPIPRRAINFPPLQIHKRETVIRLPGKAQSQYGYALLAPAPSDRASYAFRILLYVMTHGYEGRLGKELIGQTGLIYYISSDYKSDGKNAWISIAFGVNPDKLRESKETFNRILNELQQNPPSAEEIAEAEEYLIGRRITAAASDAELTAFYAKESIEQGRLRSDAEFEKLVRSITADEVLHAIPAFLNGARAEVDTNL